MILELTNHSASSIFILFCLNLFHYFRLLGTLIFFRPLDAAASWVITVEFLPPPAHTHTHTHTHTKIEGRKIRAIKLVCKNFGVKKLGAKNNRAKKLGAKKLEAKN